MIIQTKRKVFVSYHHQNDQSTFNLFTKKFSNSHEIFHDNSLERAIQSDNSLYINQAIKERCIHGSSTTIVLCGAETFKRKYVDWEIHATLDYQHALIGIPLPSASRDKNNKILIPQRLLDNIRSGFALWLPKYPDNELDLAKAIEEAIELSKKTTNICNDKPKMQRNQS